MARRKLEQLRDDVIAAAYNYHQVWALDAATSNTDRFAASATLHEAVRHLTEYLDPILNSAGEYVEGSPETSRNAALAFMPHSGSMRRKIVDEIYSVQFWRNRGLTDSELEHRLKSPHQTVSSARNWLVNSGWLRDSGARRENPSGRPAVVWNLTDAVMAKLTEPFT